MKKQCLDARGRVAWIESKGDDIAILSVAAGGLILYQRDLSLHDTSNWGYEGCTGSVVAWLGDRVILVTQECSRSYLWSVDPDRRIHEVIPMQWAWVIDGDLAVWVRDDPGLLSTVALPLLDDRPPLPFRGAPPNGDIRLRMREDGRLDILLFGWGGNRTIDTLALPTDRQRAEYVPVDGLLDAVERRLFPASGAPMAGRLVIEAVALPFVRGASWRGRCQPAPVWMPVYWYRHLASTRRASEAGELLDVLDAIAEPLPEAEPEYGWDPEWSAAEGQVALTVRHVRRRARILAGACRSGALPPGWWCLLFDPAPRTSVPGSRVDSAGFPPILRRVFEDLVPTSPERFPRRL